MRVAGSRSWELRQGVDQHQHLALFARDALGLTGAADQVPRLVGDVPDSSALIGDADRTAAAVAWQSWWEAIITVPRVTAAMIEAGTVPALPEPGDPLLERAVEAVRPEAYDWFSRHEPAPTFPDGNRRRWLIAKRAVDATVADLGVSPGQISASLNLLLVQGRWWQRLARGRALYSPAVDADDDQLYELLCETFASSVL